MDLRVLCRPPSSETAMPPTLLGDGDDQTKFSPSVIYDLFSASRSQLISLREIESRSAEFGRFAVCADFCSAEFDKAYLTLNLILARRKLTQLTCPRGCGRASFAEGQACSPPHPCGTVRGVRGASLAEGRARSPPARSRTDISNPPGRSPPPCRRARVREPEPDPGARGLSPPSRGTGARDHLKGAATAPLSPDPIPPRQRDLYPIEGGVADPVPTPRPPHPAPRCGQWRV